MSDDTPTRVLVVDDESTARLLMRAALRKAGFEVHLAADGEEALRRFAEAPCDMVMLDVDMPGLSGFDICAVLRAQAGEHLPIVMVTGMDDVESVEQAYHSGATDFIAKPINWALLGHRVRYLWRAHETSRALHRAEARHAAILAAIPDLLFEVDLDGRIHDHHSPRRDLLAAPAQAFIGKLVTEILPPKAAEVCLQALQSADQDGSSTGRQYELDLPTGPHWFELSVARRAVEPGQPTRFVALARDITERKQAEAHVTSLAYFDSLTGLPNRRAFLEGLGREVARSARSGSKLAVLFMDLDGFKGINDTLGHDAGDEILRAAAERMRASVRPSDWVTRRAEPGASDTAIELARLGGDEFTAMILDLSRTEDALAVAQRIQAEMRLPFTVAGRELSLSTSIGIAVCPDDAGDPAALLKHADAAMYHAKKSGRDNVQFYRSELTDDLLHRLDIEASLRHSLERREFELRYQPRIQAADAVMDAVRVQLCWNHPVHGQAEPASSLAIAEDKGLMGPIGAWVLRQACDDLQAWRQAGTPAAGLAIPLTPSQLKTAALASATRETLANTGLPPPALEFEISEGHLAAAGDSALATLQALHELGCPVTLTGFGSGGLSIARLRELPISALALDPALARTAVADGTARAIVQAVVAMARTLGLPLRADGLQTIEQARTLRALGCVTLQGRYIGQRLLASEVTATMRRRLPHWNAVAVHDQIAVV
ncbi:putative bifunctional diguanylate cyclase/phosphodiesterase [Sphaerotilus microaerophilus]|uniref:GGDEF domain-containing response regulator n=1 Tax=Sphaerotilus microaerophilus TaxID=2914710 RepID=A0ABM7YH97_9BURK|nr:EAL domain-containing protein [Sphaerotilus sp. FB-5]BDI03901.1 GGDEF domain-containing response regulator [Sphaerotilus sp. FB-5]